MYPSAKKVRTMTQAVAKNLVTGVTYSSSRSEPYYEDAEMVVAAGHVRLLLNREGKRVTEEWHRAKGTSANVGTVVFGMYMDSTEPGIFKKGRWIDRLATLYQKASKAERLAAVQRLRREEDDKMARFGPVNDSALFGEEETDADMATSG